MIERRGLLVALAALPALASIAAACASSGGESASKSSPDGSTEPVSVRDAGGTAAPAPTSSVDAGEPSAPPPGDGGSVTGLGAAPFAPGDLDPPSNGGTITFQQIGATGWYPSRRDPATGPCDASDGGTCCLAKEEVTSDLLTPWDQDLVMTLRGPMQVKQLAVYQPGANAASGWQLASGWDERQPTVVPGVDFDGNATPTASFVGGVGSECSVNVSTASPYACGTGSLPYCPVTSTPQYFGWAGSKLFVILAKMAHAGTTVAAPLLHHDDR